MRVVYALEMSVGDGASDQVAAHLGTCDVVRTWVEGWHARAGRTLVWPDGVGEVIADGTPTGRVDVHDDLPGGFRLWTLDWVYRDQKDPTLEWKVAVAVASSGSATEFSIQIGIRSTEFQVKPVRFDLGTPRVVRELAGAYPCSVGDSRASADVHTFTAATAPAFAVRIQDPARTIPIVLVSPQETTEQPIVPPAQLAYDLTGLAEVYTADRLALYGLSSLVGKVFSCYDGAVRVYYPGLDLRGVPFHHPLYLPQELERQRALGREFCNFLLRRLAADAAARIADGPVLAACRRAVATTAQAQAEEAAARRQEAARNSADHKVLLKLLSEAEVAEIEGNRRIAELKGDVERLTDENRDLRANFRLVSQASEAEPDFVEADPEEAIETVEDAVDAAVRRFPEQLVILDRARDSAKASPYRQPRKVFDLLKAFGEVATLWQDAAPRGGRMGRSWKQLLDDRGFEWKERISDTSRGKWGQEYTFKYQAEHVIFEEHVTLGAGQPETCISVHVHRDEQRRKLVIGHVGRHLRNTST